MKSSLFRRFSTFVVITLLVVECHSLSLNSHATKKYNRHGLSSSSSSRRYPKGFSSSSTVSNIDSITSLPTFGVRTGTTLKAMENDNGDNSSGRKKQKKKSNNSTSKKKRKKKLSKLKNKKKETASSTRDNNIDEEEERQKKKKKAEVMKQLREKLDEKKGSDKSDNNDNNSNNNGGGILGKLNPFQAGQNVRQAIASLGTVGGLSQETKQKYFLDDRLLEKGGAVLTERNPYLERLERDDFVPEVLVVGATGEVGRLVVRRLLLEGRFRVRVLVRDLYSQTLNLLGTGVTYCQGELGNIESLEYALTDVDKIVFCAGAPRPDESGFQERFKNYMKENLIVEGTDEDSIGRHDVDDGSTPKGDEATTYVPIFNIDNIGNDGNQTVTNEYEWEQLNSVLEVRATLAEQVDCIGMQNLVKAYQNVRHADYGTSQAAKRSIFKFSGRVGDFNLFALDESPDVIERNDGDDDDDAASLSSSSSDTSYGDNFDNYDDVDSDDDYGDYDEYDDDEDGEDEGYYDELYSIESRRDANVKSQVQWIRNEFGNGVFVGKVPKEVAGVGGEAAIVSSRLRSRESPDKGIDLSGSFAGFIVRLCGDGGNYEAFIRAGSFDEDGIEYVCKFSTSTKPTSSDNKSRNKFTTVRLAFNDFEPVRKNSGDDDVAVPPFKGSDVQYIGFRYRSGSNKERAKWQQGEFSNFYLALSYVKVYRLQPEPEFIYLSDARIPPHIRNGMVRHDRRELLQMAPSSSSDEAAARGEDGGAANDAVQIFDEKTLADVTKLERSSEETYFKYRGEEMLKSSGLSYTIVRVAGFNEVPSGEASTIDLQTSNEGIVPVSRDEAAQVCVNALLDPHALNKVVYMSKKKSGGGLIDEDLSAKFAALEVSK